MLIVKWKYAKQKLVVSSFVAVVNKAGINSSVQTCVCVCVNISIQINWANVGVCAQLLSHVQLFETPQPIAHGFMSELCKGKKTKELWAQGSQKAQGPWGAAVSQVTNWVTEVGTAALSHFSVEHELTLRPGLGEL